MATTRVEQKSRAVKRKQYKVTWATANNSYSAHAGRIPRRQRKVYPVGKGYGPYGVKSTVAGEVVNPSQTHVPASASTGISRTANVVVTYSEAMNPNTVKIEVRPAGGSPLAGTLSYVVATKVLTFDPAATLAANTLHTVQVWGADLYGNQMGTLTYQFTTGA